MFGPYLVQAELAADVISQHPLVELVRGVVACLAANVSHLGVCAAAEQLLDQKLVALPRGHVQQRVAVIIDIVERHCLRVQRFLPSRQTFRSTSPTYNLQLALPHHHP